MFFLSLVSIIFPHFPRLPGKIARTPYSKRILRLCPASRVFLLLLHVTQLSSTTCCGDKCFNEAINQCVSVRLRVSRLLSYHRSHVSLFHSVLFHSPFSTLTHSIASPLSTFFPSPSRAFLLSLSSTVSISSSFHSLLFQLILCLLFSFLFCVFSFSSLLCQSSVRFPYFSFILIFVSFLTSYTCFLLYSYAFPPLSLFLSLSFLSLPPPLFHPSSSPSLLSSLPRARN